MAESTVTKDKNDSFGLSDSDDVPGMDELRNMIRRPDWLEVFKKQCEEQEVKKSQKESTPEKPLDVSLSDTECIFMPEAESSKPKRRQKHKNTMKTGEPEVHVSEPAVQKRQPEAAKKSTKSKCSAQKSSRRTRQQSTEKTGEPEVHISKPAVQKGQPEAAKKSTKSKHSMQKSSRRTGHQSTECLRTNADQNVDPEIVFLSDDEPAISGCRTGYSATSDITANAVTDSFSDDSIEIISETCKTSNGEETYFENKDINILFFWQNKVVTLPMKQDTQFSTVFQTLLNKWEVHDAANVMLLYQDKIIKAIDTPSDHKMLSGSLVDVSIVKSKISLSVGDPNVITIKLQKKNCRDKKHMAVNQMSQFRSIIERFAKEEGVPAGKVTFRFDGDTISHTDTPFGLGIENDFSIDVTY